MSTADSAIINRILTSAIERRASDVHLTAGNQPMLRYDGKLEPMADEAVVAPPFLQELIAFFLTEHAQAVLEARHYVVVGYSLGGKARFRVHASYQKGYPSFDLRYIPLQVATPAILGLPKRLVELMGAREGLVLITGPLGSGRTTTLSSLVDSINHSTARHVVMLAEPIEYVLGNDKSLIEQRTMGDDVSSIGEALDDVRNEDVDVLAVDVLLPSSAWPQLVTLATSGTLVLVVMEADSTVRALEYLTTPWPNLSPESMRLRLSEGLLGVSCQRLIPRLGGGRVLACEILLGTQPVRSLIHEGRVHQVQTIVETSREEGMVPLEYQLATLVKNGDVLREEALLQAVHRETLESLLKPK